MNTQTTMTLLLVDDEPDLRDILAEEFRDLGYGVFEAENGLVALKVLEANPIGLVISDIRMPKGDGISLLKEIRKRDPKFPGVILISGFSDVDREQAIKLGALNLFAKPFDFSELKKAVKDYFAALTP